MSKFIHLHTHSHYSLLNALPKIPALVGKAKECGMQALALTDNGNLYGAIEFYKECKKQDIKPIIGIDAYVAIRSRFDKEAGVDDRFSRLVLLAKDITGYKNLLKIVTASHLEGFYNKPRIDKELLEKYAAGLIAILPSSGSETTSALSGQAEQGNKKAAEIIDWYKKVFGSDDVFLEVTHHPKSAGHQAVQQKIVLFAKETKTPVVAASEIYYLKPEDRKARETLVNIQTGGGAEQTGFDDADKDFSFIDQTTAEKYFGNIPDALANTIVIAERCNLELELGAWIFPDMELPEGISYEEALRKATYAGIAWRGLKKDETLVKRIEYEFGIIKEKGFLPYFLVVADLLRYARKNDILTTTRGSAAGSVVSYLNGITNIDPLKYNLPFERFLNPERPKAPDIDMDFADNRRDEVIAYVKQKYGEDKVAQIGTFGTMMARAAVRDVTRSLGYPYGTGDHIAKLIPFGSQGFPMRLDKAMEIVPELREVYKKDREVKEIIDLAKKIEGCARHISVHAAGVVIAPRPLEEFVPLQFDPKGGKIITQYDMYSVSEEYGGVGLVKFDFLGIKNLSILSDAVKRAKKFENADVDIENIPIDDKKTFAMLARGETEGLFQLGGSGMTRFLKELEPTSIHDINAMVALYRPGPMESIPIYIERKHNPQLVNYLDPRMKEILSQSYGVITYQDDVLMIAIKIAGYSWREVDALRKAMGKKIPAEMEAQREKLISGAITNGMSKDKAERLWKLIEPFAGYGFNKAHAASYGKVAYQTAYMKANFPALYMAAVLTADSGDIEKVSVAVTECKRMNIPVLPPDINESFASFTVARNKDNKGVIRFGLSSIKNFGEGIAETIIQNREKHGKFTSLADFLERITERNLNKKSLESLIKCGALDFLSERGRLIGNIDTLLTFSKEIAAVPTNQDSLFGALPDTSKASLSLKETPQAHTADKLTWEKELLGIYVSGHPLDAYREKLEKQQTTIQHIKEELREGMPTVISGIVEESKQILTKGGDQMAFIRIADYSGNIEVVAFPKIFAKNRELLSPEKCIMIKGRISGRNGTPSIIAEAVKEL